MINVSETRERLCGGIYTTLEPTNPLGLLQEALLLCPAAELIERRIRVDGVKTGRVTALDLPSQITQALAAGIVTPEEAESLRAYDRKVMELVHVDDFDPSEIGTMPRAASPAAVAAASAA